VTVIIVKVLLIHSKILKLIEKMHDLCKTIFTENGYKDINLLSGIKSEKRTENNQRKI